MDLREFDTWCRSFLDIESMSEKDDSLNGVQVGRSSKKIGKVAFAVDACAETIRRAGESEADILFVHHGLFWGKPRRIEGYLLERIRLLVESDIALYACHLPLDMHPEVGNNAVLASLLDLREKTPFGIYHGAAIGVSGALPEPLALDEIVKRLLPDNSRPRCVIGSGRPAVSKVAIISGGAPFEVMQTFGTDIELYVTGEPSHSIYHDIVENKLDFIAAGHYATEVWGVKAVAAKLAKEHHVDTTFIDIPTGL